MIPINHQTGPRIRASVQLSLIKRFARQQVPPVRHLHACSLLHQCVNIAAERRELAQAQRVRQLAAILERLVEQERAVQIHGEDRELRRGLATENEPFPVLLQEQIDRKHRRVRCRIRLVAVEHVVEDAEANLGGTLFEVALAPVAGPLVAEFCGKLRACSRDLLTFLALLGRERCHRRVVQRRCMFVEPLSPQVAGGMVVRHPEFPVAVWVLGEPALADEELQHRAQRTDRFQHLPCVGERVNGTQKAALAADETDNRAPMGREGPSPQMALECGDHVALVDAAGVEEREPERSRLRRFLTHLRHAKEPTAHRYPKETARCVVQISTSDHKRAPVYRLMTRLAAEQRAAGITGRRVRILNVMGLRAHESAKRALMLQAARSNNRFLDKRIADLEAQMLGTLGGRQLRHGIAGACAAPVSAAS